MSFLVSDRSFAWALRSAIRSRLLKQKPSGQSPCTVHPYHGFKSHPLRSRFAVKPLLAKVLLVTPRILRHK
jgi:hypothetical protein